MKNIIYMVIFSTLLGCNSQTEIEELIKKNTTDSYVLASYKIGERKDTAFIDFLFNELNDSRISHDVRFKGISVYQGKVTALMKMSGFRPPVSITNEPDSVVIKFYTEWYKKWRSQAESDNSK
jgi:hypothetical protein